MPTLVDRAIQADGSIIDLFEEDARLYKVFHDPYEATRMENRKQQRMAPGLHRTVDWGRAVGDITPNEQRAIIKQYPHFELDSKDPEIQYKGWKRFWNSSISERYRVVSHA